MMNSQVIKPRNHSEQLATPRFLMLPISSDFRSSGASVIIFSKNEEKNTAQINNCLSELDSVWQFVYHSMTLSLLLYVIICLKLYFHFLFAKMVKKLSIDQKKNWKHLNYLFLAAFLFD